MAWLRSDCSSNISISSFLILWGRGLMEFLFMSRLQFLQLAIWPSISQILLWSVICSLIHDIEGLWTFLFFHRELAIIFILKQFHRACRISVQLRAVQFSIYHVKKRLLRVSKKWKVYRPDMLYILVRVSSTFVSDQYIFHIFFSHDIWTAR